MKKTNPIFKYFVPDRLGTKLMGPELFAPGQDFTIGPIYHADFRSIWGKCVSQLTTQINPTPKMTTLVFVQNSKKLYFNAMQN